MPILSSNEIFFTKFEPHTINRFIMYIDGIPSFLIHKVKLPTVDVGEITLDHINIYRKIKGKAKWGDMNFSLYDAITPSAGQAAMEWFRLSHESVSGRDGYSDFYKRDLRLNQLGPVGDLTSEWIIKGAFIKSLDFGEGDYSNYEGYNDIQVSIGMDYCIRNY